MIRFRSEDGQVTVMAAAMMVFLIAMVAFVLDVGSWFRQQRVTQSNVDAAALAGAQALPGDPVTASSYATTFANKNAGIAGAAITIKSKWVPNDSITVTQTRQAEGFFAKVLGISTVNVHAKATAISEIPSEALGVAPIVVDIRHPKLSGQGCPCFNQPTTIDLGKKGAPGAFGMLDLANGKGNTGTSTLADWILNGYDKYLPLGDYDSDPGAKFNSSQIQGALQSRYGTDLLFPIYDSLTGNGSNAEYHIIGWASFHITLSQASGNNGTISGYFDRVIWQGIVSKSGPPVGVPDLGVHSVALID
jgi:putative Flp pilus-assembly TadE/G-like protein